MSSIPPIKIYEYESFPNPIEISINKLEKFYSEFKNKFEIKPDYDNYMRNKDDITKHHRYNEKTHKFRMNLKAKFYIGIIKLPNEQTVIIKSKVGQDVKFLHMFEYVDPQYAQIFYEITQHITPESNFLKILIEKFLTLVERLLRSSLMKNYQNSIIRSNKIKGKINQRNTIKNPNFLKGYIVCEFDDFTQDISENQIIKLALFKLRYIADKNQQTRIRQLLIEMDNVSFKKFKVEDIEKIKYTHLNLRYKEIHNYCKMIIGKFSFGFEEGNHEWFSMLLNSWDIYERFLRKIFEIYLKEIIGTELSVQKQKIGKWNSWDEQKLLPDIIMSKNNKILLICDAKYKLSYSVGDRRQGREYIHEFLKKHERGDLSFNMKNRNMILIYPSNELENYEFYPLEDHPVQKYGCIYAHSIDLTKIDNKRYLESWVENIYNKFLI